ncbi:MAG: peptidyl-prolyl cis-trans isomerase [Candidatus Gastranaerophilales bacterium]|nr:peptidyl-prolyl cis-trans isomerase [Candidatus Gastranaerophilales bacterium]
MSNLFRIIFCLLIMSFMILCNSKYTFVEAKELYNNNKEIKMSQAKEVRASHILVQTKEQAEKVRDEILAGKDFADAAQEYSSCPSGKQGGDLGYFGRGMMVPEFEKAAFELPVNQVSEPVKTQFGWHLIVVTDKK